jgi:predicted glycosyltransferase/mRNA-degrading endonuclease toxin of MazEF toxin-antitoxin module
LKNFDEWNELKKKLNSNNKLLNFREREVFFISMGVNVGFEVYGKGDCFLRPVVILKKFSKYSFLAVPLSSKLKNGNFYHEVKFSDRTNIALLSQIRTFDTRRLRYKIGKLSIKEFKILKDKISEKCNLSKERSEHVPQKVRLSEFERSISKKPQFVNKNIIWFDLVTPKSVLFFKPMIDELKKRNQNILVTAREGNGYSEVVELLKLYNIEFFNRGTFGGGNLKDKLHASIERQKALMEFITLYDVQKLVCLSSVDAVRVAFGLGLPVINFYDIPLSDYKTNFKKALPQARLTIPLASKMFKPFVVPDEVIERFGLEKEQIIEYNFIDPLIWLKDFKFDKDYVDNFYQGYNIDRNKFTIVIREEEYKSSYVDKKYPFLYEVIPEIYEKFNVNIIVIPRYESNYLKKEFPFAYVIDEKIKLQHLLKDVDLFIGGGGTINTESCFLGTQTISTRSFISHYDKWQIDNNLMFWTNNKKELIALIKKAIEFKLKPNIKILETIEVDLELLVNNIVK